MRLNNRRKNETIFWATLTPEQRSARLKKVAKAMTPEALSERGRKNALAQGKEDPSKRMHDWQMSRR